MGFNKFMDRVGNVLLDLTSDDVTPNDVLNGKLFHDRTGKQQVGTLKLSQSKNEIESDKVNFIDYDGTLIASYTIQEAKQLNALPDLPSHTNENITPAGWTETLDKIKNTNQGMLVGAMYNTIDGCSYLYVNMKSSSYLAPTLRLYNSGAGTISVDWGDGSSLSTSSTSGAITFTHTYSSIGEYVIKISSTAKYYFNTSSSNYLFGSQQYNSYIEKIRLSNKVDRIYSYNFYHCRALESITLPYGITNFSTYAFEYCYALKTVVIPYGVSATGSSAFEMCYGLENVVIPSSVTTLTSNTFQKCYSLEKVFIPSSVTTIQANALNYCYGLKEVIGGINSSLTGTYVFGNSFKLKSISVQSETIQSYTFSNDYELEHVNLLEGVKTIGQGAFTSCFMLKNIAIPSTVTAIQPNAFQACSSLKEIDLTALETPPALTNKIFTDGYEPTLKISSDIINQFKADTYWNAYSKHMVAVDVI